MSQGKSGERNGHFFYSAQLDRKELHKNLDLLIDLHEETRPENGDLSSAEKNRKAIKAISLGLIIFGSACRWPLRHFVGAELLKHETQFSDESALDDHTYEIAGHQFWSEKSAPIVDVRRVLAMLMGLLFQMFPRSVESDVPDALRALNFGETRPAVTPEKTGRHGPAFSLDSLRFRAVEHVAYLNGTGLKKEAAQHLVALKFGVDEGTVKGWAKRLPDTFISKSLLDKRLDFAKQMGRRSSRLGTSSTTDSADPIAEYYRQRFEANDLDAWGHEFRALTGIQPEADPAGEVQV